MYAVAGVSGYVSGRVADLILTDVGAKELVVTTRNEDVASEWRSRGVDTRIADYDDRDSLVAAFQGVTHLFMISGMEAGPKRQVQHHNVVTAAEEAGVQHIVYTSFIGADSPGATSLEVADHQFTEGLIQSSKMTWNFMRNSQYADAMAENQAAIAISSGTSIGNTGDGRVAFVTRDDVAAVGAALMLGRGTPNTGYDVTGPEALTYADIGRMISDISGANIEITNLTDEEMYSMWDALGVPREATGDFTNSPVPWCSDGMVTLGRMIREGHCDNVTSVVLEMTGRAPKSMQTLMEEKKHTWPAVTEGTVS